MDGYVLAGRWLANAAVGGLIVLAMGGLAVRLCRQPARRARLVVLTLVGGLAVAVLMAVPITPRWSAGMLPALEPDRTRMPIGPRARADLGRFADRDRVVNAPAHDRADGRDPGPGPAAAPAAWIPGALGWPALIPVAYAAIAAGLAAWWLFGQLVLWRATRQARPAPQVIRDVFLQLTGPAGARVRLLVSDRIALPFTYTWLRPVILVPAALCDRGEEDALKYGLAHEWSHVERRDSWAWNLAALAGAVLFYQPLFWWLRRQLRLCQDYLADDRAAALGSPEDYAAYLVRLARGRQSGSVLPALGIGGRPSNLRQRIVMLVADRQPWERRCRTAWSVAAGLAAVVAIAAVSGLRLEAADPGKPRPQPATDDTTKAKAGKTYVGRVTDKDTGRPIAGASVFVSMAIIEEPLTAFGPPKDLADVTLTTDAEGTYRFTISPEQMATPSLHLSVGVHQPGYVDRSDDAPYRAIARDEQAGKRPWFEALRLSRGKAIEGRLVNLEGSPVAGVTILALCSGPDFHPAKDSHGFEGYNGTEALTDANGRFRFDAFPTGSVIYWVESRDYAPSVHILRNGERGDMGTITLKRGTTIQGKVLDAQGKPVPGVYVQADRERPEELVPNFTIRIGEEGTGLDGPQRPNNLGAEEEVRLAQEYASRTVVTAGDGGFTIRALPAGNYRVAPVDETWDFSLINGKAPTRRPLPGVFMPMTLTLKDGATREPVVIRGVPHVVVEAGIHDSKGNPTKGVGFQIMGTIGGDSWGTYAASHAERVTTVFAPHGLENATLFANPTGRTVSRHRLSKDAPLSTQMPVLLGTLDHDVKGIEIVGYVSPTVVVKVSTRDGSKPAELALWADYAAKEDWRGGRSVLGHGVLSVCSFERQEDGRFRTAGLYPDLELTISARARGYAAKTSPAFTLAEGATRELELVLEKGP